VGANEQIRHGSQGSDPTLEPQRMIVGPDGYRVTLSDLPPHDTKRWVPRRKAMVVFAVEGGLISTAEVCERYRLSPEEFVGWRRLIRKHGVRGLRTTKVKLYRESE